MTDNEPERIDADVTPDDDAEGTTSGDPIAGVRMTEEQADHAVEPDDDVTEVDGPTQKHA